MDTPPKGSKAREDRRFFRVKFVEPLKGRLKPVYPETETVVPATGEVAPVLDLSTAGARVRIEANPPPGKKVVVDLSFDLDESSFADLRGEVVWSRSEERVYACGISFVGLPVRQERRLFQALNSYQIKKARYSDILHKGTSLRYRNKIRQILELLPYPALLISDERRIVAVNRPAEASGLAPGRSCFDAVFGANAVCRHCRLEEAVTSENIARLEMIFNGRPHEFTWFYPGGGYVIYCIREMPD